MRLNLISKSKGTGLGLFFSYGIIQEHGGWIDVQSGPGRRTTFTIGLPLEQPVLPQRCVPPERRPD